MSEDNVEPQDYEEEQEEEQEDEEEQDHEEDEDERYYYPHVHAQDGSRPPRMWEHGWRDIHSNASMPPFDDARDEETWAMSLYEWNALQKEQETEQDMEDALEKSLPDCPVLFRQLEDLPLEVQHMIWTWSLPRARVHRVERIRHYGSRYDRMGDLSQSFVGSQVENPVQLRTCPTSRLVALKYYDQLEGMIHLKSYIPTYFDFELDTLYISPSLGFGAEAQRKLVRVFRCLERTQFKKLAINVADFALAFPILKVFRNIVDLTMVHCRDESEKVENHKALRLDKIDLSSFVADTVAIALAEGTSAHTDVALDNYEATSSAQINEDTTMADAAYTHFVDLTSDASIAELMTKLITPGVYVLKSIDELTFVTGSAPELSDDMRLMDTVTEEMVLFRDNWEDKRVIEPAWKAPTLRFASLESDPETQIDITEDRSGCMYTRKQKYIHIRYAPRGFRVVQSITAIDRLEDA